MNNAVTDNYDDQYLTDTEELGDSGFPNNIEGNFAIQIALSIKRDDSEYFIKLLTPSFFSELTMKDKFEAAVIAIGLADGDMKKYIHHLLLDTSINRTTFDASMYSLLVDEEFTYSYLIDLLNSREFKKLDAELPINNIKEEKKTKV